LENTNSEKDKNVVSEVRVFEAVSKQVSKNSLTNTIVLSQDILEELDVKPKDFVRIEKSERKGQTALLVIKLIFLILYLKINLIG
jgi:hypothetical protein